MDFSDQLAKLSARAKQAETRAAAAQSKARSDLEADIATARASAQAQAQKLREGAEATQGKISHRWAAVQKTWTEYIAAVHETIDEANEGISLVQAQRAADVAEDDASYAIDYAYSAIEQAEYDVLQAEFARMKADELEAAARATA
jgi:hypothetical protein